VRIWSVTRARKRAGIHHEAGDVEEGLLRLGEGLDEVRFPLLVLVDGHCRSHNIAAECCVASSCGSGAGFESRISKSGGEMVAGRSLCSCLIEGCMLMTVSAGEAGLAVASMEPRDCVNEGGGGVNSL